MRIADFTQEGGLPFDQETLNFLQAHSFEIVDALISHFVLDVADSYIISGCEVVGPDITSGWMIIAGELLHFDQAAGDSTSEIGVNITSTTLTHQNGVEHENYVVKTAVIEQGGIALDDFIRIPNALDFVTNLDFATESNNGIVRLATEAEVQEGVEDSAVVTPAALETKTATLNRRGIAKIASTSEVQAGTDNEKIVTPYSLGNYIKVLKIGSQYLGDAVPSGGNALITIYLGVSVATTNYMVLGSLRAAPGYESNWDNENDQAWTVISRDLTSFQIAIKEISSHTTHTYFDYLLIKL